MTNNQPKIVFFGTPEFGVKPLEALVRADFNVTGVITAPDKPIGRRLVLTPSSVKIEAKKHNLPVFQPENKAELLEIVKNLKPDLAVVAAFGMIFTKEILEIPKYGFLNIHASLLPRWRGASPIQSAILAGDEKAGITIMLLNEKMDEGPTLAISNLKSQILNLNYKELENELAELGGKLLVETIPKWINGEIKPQPQDHSKATYTKKITKEDGLIDWNEPVEITERKIRAFTPWPGAYTFVNGRRLIIIQAELKNNALKIKRVKPEGKNEMDFADYLRGNSASNIEQYL
ncbi:MAG: methionyl-tRNA formyltransferase [bacterium]|nr:methionyl-tRNA formyltransferase [bacterium]